MAGHYLACAAELEFERQASKKLVLMCIADDADKASRIAAVGLDEIMRWSGLKRTRALEVVAELVDEGYLVRHAAGRIGRYAEFVVFPAGCCALHGPVDGYEPPADDEPAQQDDADEETEDAGSALPDPASEQEGPVEGPVQGPVASGPLPTELLNKNPPNPPASRGAKCEHGRSSCRHCGTSPRSATRRQLLADAEAAAAELEQLERARSALPWCGDRSCDRHSRWRETDRGQTRCPLCHPDVAIPRPAPELVELAARLPELRRTG